MSVPFCQIPGHINGEAKGLPDARVIFLFGLKYFGGSGGLAPLCRAGQTRAFYQSGASIYPAPRTVCR
ncbi:hypothetical protein Z950_3660 [Sulfitobacter mediterraneus KCTC 32188]|nr:hypothetical protein Z950_3660 [Sulfitobacter mediterraneus KCTC 32188]